MQKLMEFVERHENGCWLWNGPLCAGGRYGRVTGQKQWQMAHRYSYRHHKGEIPNGMYVCHSCDNGLCVNPDHLFLGTPKDNFEDMVNKGRSIFSTAESGKGVGEGNARALLKAEQVLEMRNMREEGASYEQLRKSFNLKSRGHVGAIISRRLWNHI